MLESVCFGHLLGACFDLPCGGKSCACSVIFQSPSRVFVNTSFSVVFSICTELEREQKEKRYSKNAHLSRKDNSKACSCRCSWHAPTCIQTGNPDGSTQRISQMPHGETCTLYRPRAGLPDQVGQRSCEQSASRGSCCLASLKNEIRKECT